MMRVNSGWCYAVATVFLWMAITEVAAQGVQIKSRPLENLKVTGPLYLLMTRPNQNVRILPRNSSKPAIAAIALSIRSRPIQDSRCYLMNGGAVESFYIAEDTPVGSVIGTLSVNGDPSDTGNISLRLQEKDAAIGIAPGTKNITLLKKLDREELEGPSNVYVNVRCDRRRTTDPSFVIPVSVRVWDVNDHSPTWSAAQYRARVSELASVGSRLPVTLAASDRDPPGPNGELRFTVLPGPNSDYFAFPNELESVLVIRRPLDFETNPNMTLVLRATDGGSTPRHSDVTLTVTLDDADDQNPAFLASRYSATIPNNAKEGMELEISPEPIRAVDQDKGINAPVYYSISAEQSLLVSIDKDTGQMRIRKPLLEAELPVTIVVKATQYDNADRYALTTLTISRPRANPGERASFIQKLYSVSVPEDTPPGTVLTTLMTTGTKAPLQFYVSERSFLDKFGVNGRGEVLLRRALDYEAETGYLYQVMLTDGYANDTATLNITVQNVNDWEPRFRHPHYEFRLDQNNTSTNGLVGLGRLDVFDGDRGDAVELALHGPQQHLFYINESGDMFIRGEALSSLNTSQLILTATATDSGNPPRQSAVPVVVRLPPRAPRPAAALVGALAAALLAVASVVVLAACYVKRSKSSRQPTKESSEYPGRKSVPGTVPSNNVTNGNGDSLERSGSLQSVSAGASTILRNSSSSLDVRTNNETSVAPVSSANRQPRCKSRIAPLPPGTISPQSTPNPTIVPTTGTNALLSDHLCGARGRSGVAWPSGTIPARVKKLSWDDTDVANRAAGSNPEIHDATNPNIADNMNLTVYF